MSDTTITDDAATSGKTVGGFRRAGGEDDTIHRAIKYHDAVSVR